MKEILLVGAGGHCKSCIEIIEEEKKFKIIGIIDNIKKRSDFGYPIIGKDKDFAKIRKITKYACITIGQIKSSAPRRGVYEKLQKLNFKLPVIISPRAHVSKRAKLNQGTIVHHDVCINSNVKIGKNCIINTKSIIEHDVNIGDFCHISTRATVNGHTKIESDCFLGSCSVIKQNIKISKNKIIQANVFLKKDT
jgi:sugar O-acyltransferase (sialic acid O-acetyltransferase NeuD family)